LSPRELATNRQLQSSKFGDLSWFAGYAPNPGVPNPRSDEKMWSQLTGDFDAVVRTSARTPTLVRRKSWWAGKTSGQDVESTGLWNFVVGIFKVQSSILVLL